MRWSFEVALLLVPSFFVPLPLLLACYTTTDSSVTSTQLRRKRLFQRFKLRSVGELTSHLQPSFTDLQLSSPRFLTLSPTSPAKRESGPPSSLSLLPPPSQPPIQAACPSQHSAHSLLTSTRSSSPEHQAMWVQKQPSSCSSSTLKSGSSCAI